MKSKNFQKNQNPSPKIETVDIKDIFEDIVERLQKNNKEVKKKIEFDKKGSLKVVDIQKETNQKLNSSKLDLISGSLVNNYWPGESLYTKDRLSRFDDNIISVLEDKNEQVKDHSVNEKLKKTSQRARELVIDLVYIIIS
jgi:hypothetical protein